MSTLTLYSPSGVLAQPAALKLAARRLGERGFTVRLDESALARRQRFAGDDDTRLAAIHRVAAEAPSVALASRGGYGLTRLLDRIDWPLLGRSVEQGTRWVGYSDLTALHLGLMAHVPGALKGGDLLFQRRELAALHREIDTAESRQCRRAVGEHVQVAVGLVHVVVLELARLAGVPHAPPQLGFHLAQLIRDDGRDALRFGEDIQQVFDQLQLILGAALDRLQRADFDVFRPELRSRDWRLPCSS